MAELENQLIQSYFKEGQSPADIQESQIAEKEIKSRYGQKTGAGLLDAVLTPEQRLLFGIAQGTLSRKDRLTPTQSTSVVPSQIPQMPEQYDTSPYRALDILGAGIARRPTQEGYFNQLEKMQNARLEDAYNRRTDTDEAKNLQGLVKQTFPNLSDDIVSKISPDYFSKNYPLLAQMAEKKDIMNAQIKNDSEAKNFIQSFFPDIEDKQLQTVNAKNVNLIYDKLSKEQIRKDLLEQKQAEEEKLFKSKIKSDQEAREKWKAIFPNSTEAQLNTINAKNFDARFASEDKKSFEREKMAEEKRRKEENASLVRALSKSAPAGEKEKPSEKAFKKDILEHFDSIAQLETARNYVNKLNRSRFGSIIPDYNYTTKANANAIDLLSAPQVKALAGPGAITKEERETFTPLTITSTDPQELALLKFQNMMSTSLSNGLKKLDIAYADKTINQNDYNVYFQKYKELADKYKVELQR
jgi:hypothetical protein